MSYVPRVFISYSHDSPEHMANVLDLAQTLRLHEGIDVQLDRFVEGEPPLSWPLWMHDQIELADYVLLVFTETYERRFRSREVPGRGLGARWEGAIVTAELYYADEDRVKFIPVVTTAADARFITGPLALTTRYDVGTPINRDLTPLVHHLTGQAPVKPAPLGPVRKLEEVAPKGGAAQSDPVLDALSLAEEDLLAGTAALETLVGLTDRDTAARAAYALGRLMHRDDQYIVAVNAFQRALDLGVTSVTDVAAEAMRVVVADLQAHMGPGSAVAAAQDWLRLVKRRRMAEVWQRIDRDLRLTLAQSWIIANEDHPGLKGYDKDELAATLARSRPPRHPLLKPFFATQLSEFSSAYATYGVDTWGAAERPRRFKLDLELVILMKSDGELFVWEPGMERLAFPLLMRRQLGDWYVASLEAAIPHPGWPPKLEPLPVEGVGFRGSEPPPDPSA